MGLSSASHFVGREPTVKTLILRNIQEIGHIDTYNPYVELSWFLCGGNVMSLDLSYNDITYLNISNACWNTKIRYVNLNHNILASGIPGTQRWFTVAPIIAGLETLTGSTMCPGDKYQEGLWDNRNTVPEYHDNGDKLSPLSKLFLQSPFSSFARYDFWLTDVLKHCRNFGTIDISQCILQEPEDLCDLIERCISPDKHLPPCPRDMPRLQPY